MSEIRDLVTWLFTDQRPPWSEQNRPLVKIGIEIGLAASLVPIYKWACNQILLEPLDGLLPALVAILSPILVGFFAALTRQKFSFLGVLNTIDWTGRIMALHLALLVLCSRFLKNAKAFNEETSHVTSEFPWWTSFDLWLGITAVVILTTAFWAWTLKERRRHGLWTACLYIVTVILARAGGLLTPDEPWWPRPYNG